MKKLIFRPAQNGWHFNNNFNTPIQTIFGAIPFKGLCGGMCLAAVNYLRYQMPIPHHQWADLNLQPEENGEKIIDITNPGQHYPMLGYIFHSQMAIHASLIILNQFVFPWDDTDENHVRWSIQDEFPRIKQAIDNDDYAIIGLRNPNKGDVMGHQVLVYGYDDNKNTLNIYDPNHCDQECICYLDNGRLRFCKINADGSESPIEQYRSYYLQLVLDPAIRSEYTTYDVLRNASTNYAVKPNYDETIRIEDIFRTKVMHRNWRRAVRP